MDLEEVVLGQYNFLGKQELVLSVSDIDQNSKKLPKPRIICS